jgi:hypothetical protein
MTNEEIYALFRAQKEHTKFGEFLENCIEWVDEDYLPNVVYEEATDISPETFEKLHEATTIFGTGYLVISGTPNVEEDDCQMS